MAEQSGTLEWLARTAGTVLRPLESILSPDDLRSFLCIETGVLVPAGAFDSPALTTALGQLASAAGQIADQISALTSALNDDDTGSAAEAAGKLLEAVTATVAAVPDIAEALQGPLPGISNAQLTSFKQGVPARVLEILAIRYVDENLLKREWLVFFGLLDQALVPGVPGAPPLLREELHIERAFHLLSAPLAHARTIYGWGDSSFRASALLGRLEGVLNAYGLTTEFTPATGSAPASLEFLMLTLRERRDGPLPGIEIELKFPISAGLSIRIPLAGGFSVEISSTGAFESGLKLVIAPPADLTWKPVAATFDGRFQVRLVGESKDPTKPFVLVGATGGSRFEAKQLAVAAGVSAKASASSVRGDVLVEADITGGKIVLDTSDGDGFIARFLGDRHFEADVSAGATWTPQDGLRFRGSAALEAVIPINRTIGPLQFQTLYLRGGLDSKAARVPLEISAAISGTLGPLTVTVDRIGVETQISFPRTGGNLGPLDFDFGFKPPSALGLVVETPFVTGGGFLGFDAAKHEYSGMLELQISGVIAVKAIGVLTTRLPDGSKGYSLVLVLFAEDFPPIQLGLGFALTGIGGLLAINRTFDEEVLRAGLKSHTLDSILFAKDPVRNAPQIISNLNKAFPPAEGHHLFGPMVQIVWGSPALVTANIALVLEIGARLRLLILAQIAAILPKPDHDLLRIQMDAIGVINFDRGTVALDASLHDSRLLKKFALTGDMALRLAWKGTRNLALAVGGLHPAFNPPPNFPKLDRVAISLSSGDNPRIRCEAYFALTANTVQFGALAELYAAAAGFNISGEVGFDVLIELNPFAFVADFHAQVQLKRVNTNLFKVRVEGELSGPHPLHVRAKATFEILWCDISVTVDKTLLAGEAAPVLAPVDVAPLLAAALRDPNNWSASLPAGQRPMVTLRGAAKTGVAVHPLATLTVKQNVVPLDLDVSRFGQTTPSGARRFSIDVVTVGGHDETPQPVKDFFAPAQFLDLTDDQKLSRPSFEQMNAGVTFSSDEVSFTDLADDWLEVPSIELETLIFDRASNTMRPSNPTERYQLTPKHVHAQSRFGAVGASDLRRSGEAKYRTTADKYRVVKERWSVVATDDLSVKNTAASYSEARQSPAAHKRGMAILRLSELTSAVS